MDPMHSMDSMDSPASVNDVKTVNVTCSVQQLWDIPGQSRLRHVHLVHALFLGRKIVSRKKFTCAYIQDPADEAVFVPFVPKKSRVLFEDVDVQPGLLLVCSVIKNLKTGKQVLSSLVVDLWQAMQDGEALFFNKELDFAPHGKGSMTLDMSQRHLASFSDIKKNDFFMAGDGDKLSGPDPNGNGHAEEKKQQPRTTISTIGTVRPEEWDSEKRRKPVATSAVQGVQEQEKQMVLERTFSPVSRSALRRSNSGSGANMFSEDAFIGAGCEAGLQCWSVVLPRDHKGLMSQAIVEKIPLQEIESNGLRSNKCYIFLHTAEKDVVSSDCRQIHTWLGRRAHEEDMEATALKAQLLARSVDPRLVVNKNVEGRELKSLLDVLPEECENEIDTNSNYTLSPPATMTSQSPRQNVESRTSVSMRIFPSVSFDSDTDVADTRDSPLAKKSTLPIGAVAAISPRSTRGDNFIQEENERFFAQTVPSPSNALTGTLSRQNSQLSIDVSSPRTSPLPHLQRSDSFSDCEYDDDDSSMGGISDYNDLESDGNSFEDEDYYDYEYRSSCSDEDEGDEVYFSDDDRTTSSPSLSRNTPLQVEEKVEGMCVNEVEDDWLFEMDVIEQYCDRQIHAHASIQRSHHHKMADSPGRVTRAYGSNPFRPSASPKLAHSSKKPKPVYAGRRGYTKGWVQQIKSSTSTSQHISNPSIASKAGGPVRGIRKESAVSTANIVMNDVNLYRIGYINEKLHVSRMAGLNSNDVDFGPPSRYMLQPKGVYILDQPDKVFLWTGKKSVGQLRAAGITFAKALIQHSRESDDLQVEGVLEGEESSFFKKHFADWRQWEKEMKEKEKEKNDEKGKRYEKDKSGGKTDIVSGTHPAQDFCRNRSMSVGPTSSKLPVVATAFGRRVSLPVSTVSVSPNPKIFQRCETAPIGRPDRRLERRRSSVVGIVDEEETVETPVHELLSRDNGQGATVVWKIHEGSFMRISDAELGHFWVHETYVILYGFTPAMDEHQIAVAEAKGDDERSVSDKPQQRKSKPIFVIYFWQGPHGKSTAYTQWKLNIFPQKKEEWMESMGKVPTEIRVSQGKEPVHFFKIFKLNYCVHFPFVEILEERKEKERAIRNSQMEILGREKQRDEERARKDPRVPAFLHAAAVRSSGAAMHKNTNRLKPRMKKSSSGHDHMTRTVDKYSSYVMEMSAGVLCFHVRGSGVDDADVHAVQIEASTCRLISTDCFITLRPLPDDKSSVWLWVGKGTEYMEQVAAGALARKLKQWFEPNRKCSLRVIEEGAVEWVERWAAKAFYRAMGGIDIYTNTKLLRIPRDERPEGLRRPTLFVCASSTGGDYSVRMLNSFSQSDLHSAGAAILDAHFAIFVWVGRECTPVLARMAMDVAVRFLGHMRRGPIKLDRKVIGVLQDNELISFVACFHGWCDWTMLDKTFIDPWRVRCEVRSSLGLVGENRVGKVTTLTKKDLEDKENKKIDTLKRAQVNEDIIRGRFRAATKSSSAKRRSSRSSQKDGSVDPPTKPWSIKSPDPSLITMPLALDDQLSIDTSIDSPGCHQCPSGAACSKSPAKDRSSQSCGSKEPISKSKMKFSTSFMSPIESKEGGKGKSKKLGSQPSPLQHLREKLRGMTAKVSKPKPKPKSKAKRHNESSFGGFFSPLSIQVEQQKGTSTFSGTVDGSLASDEFSVSSSSTGGQ